MTTTDRAVPLPRRARARARIIPISDSAATAAEAEQPYTRRSATSFQAPDPESIVEVLLDLGYAPWDPRGPHEYGRMVRGGCLAIIYTSGAVTCQGAAAMPLVAVLSDLCGEPKGALIPCREALRPREDVAPAWWTSDTDSVISLLRRARWREWRKRAGIDGELTRFYTPTAWDEPKCGVVMMASGAIRAFGDWYDPALDLLTPYHWQVLR